MLGFAIVVAAAAVSLPSVRLVETTQDAAVRPMVDTQANALVQRLRPFPTPMGVRADGSLSSIEHQRRELFRQLRRLKVSAVPELARALSDPDVQMRRNVAPALGALGSRWFDGSTARVDIRGALPALITALEDPDCSVRVWAAQAVGEVGPDAIQAVPALVVLLRNTDVGSRSSACIALHHIGAGAKPALPALETALRDPSSDVRRFAQLAIVRIRTP